MNEFTAISDEQLFLRLDQIKTQFQDFRLSPKDNYDLLTEKNLIENELKQRGYVTGFH